MTPSTSPSSSKKLFGLTTTAFLLATSTSLLLTTIPSSCQAASNPPPANPMIYPVPPVIKYLDDTTADQLYDGYPDNPWSYFNSSTFERACNCKDPGPIDALVNAFNPDFKCNKYTVVRSGSSSSPAVPVGYGGTGGAAPRPVVQNSTTTNARRAMNFVKRWMGWEDETMED
ncbi:hypothetical protein HDU76_010130 [Blyttiomyces sp. JEL0837]|nr:hypothetical protein HDU76_010130 [Blyttiomyces sp. JEL0837]